MICYSSRQEAEIYMEGRRDFNFVGGRIGDVLLHVKHDHKRWCLLAR